MMLHTLLQHQIAAHLGDQPLPANWAALADAISTTYANADAERTTLRRQNEYLATLHETTFGLLNHTGQVDLLELITVRASALLGAAHGYLFALNNDGETMSMRAATGVFSESIGFTIQRGDGLSGRVWQIERALAIHNYHEWHGRQTTLDHLELHTVLAIPLLSEGQVIGVFGMAYLEQGRTFDENEQTLIDRFAHLASLAIEHAHLYAGLEARVAQRTAELEAVNHELEREMGERMRTEGLLRERELTYRLLAQYATDVISRHTQDGTYLYVSPSCITMLGYSVDELLGQSLYALLHPEDAAALMQLGLELNPKINNYTICSRFRRRDGSYIWLETNTRIVRSPSGNTIESVIAVSRDISERRRIEAALEQERRLLTQRVEERTADLTAANVELARAARLKDEFLANMSHELRTPLNGILGLSEALREEVYGTLVAEQQQALQTIVESGQHLLTLINDILDLSKIEAGKLTIDLENVEIARVCQASLRMVRQVANQKQVAVELKIDPALVNVRADERRLKQILVNLLSNAVKFTPSGGRVGLDVQAVAAREEMRFTVWDTGIGIADEDIVRLFQPFSQLDSRLTRQYEGTGLGLALVARMTELHGGRVGVSSKPGEGSQFSIALPWIDAPFEAEAAGLDSTHAQIARLQHSRPLLLVEDNEVSIKTYSEYLIENGYRVTTARSGAEAIVRLGSAPALILMDIQMPGEDGLEIIRQIRRDTAFEQTPIIALTALAMPGDRDRCLTAGADAYLSKPISLRGLLSTIETLVRRERRKD